LLKRHIHPEKGCVNTACILIFFIIACGYSQAAVLNFNRVFNEQLNTQVKNFQQDKYGRMIIATQKKIFYFDGYELTDHPINLATKNYSQQSTHRQNTKDCG